MIDFALFLISVIIITVSGALAPGPLLLTNLSNAPRWGWKGGFWISIGHTLIELPLILLIAAGLYLLNNPLLELTIAAIGGIVLFVFAGLQIRDTLHSKPVIEPLDDISIQKSRHPLLTGLLFTGLNPFFLVWWLTIGAELIIEALFFAWFAGVLIMFVAHIWMDYAWLIGTAWVTNKGTSFIGSRGYKVLNLVLAVALIYFGIRFLGKALLMLEIL